MKLEALSEHASVLPNQAHHLDVSLRAVAPARGMEAERAPLGVVFVIDVSASMTGEPLETVKDAVLSICELLTEADRAGVVSFAREATDEVPIEPLEQTHRAHLADRVRGLENRSGTNLEGALAVATKLATDAREEGARAMILLLSDGEPSVGERDATRLAEMTRAFHEHGAVSTLGFGQHHDASLLARIAEVGRGSYHYIHDAACCTLEYARALGTQHDLSVVDLEVLVTPASGVEIEQIEGALDTTHVTDGVRLRMPDIAHEMSVTAMLSLKYHAPRERGVHELLQIQASYEDLGRKARATASAQVTLEVARRPGPPDPRVHADRLAFDARRERRAIPRWLRRGEEARAEEALEALLERAREVLEHLEPGTERAHALEELCDSVDEELQIVRRRAREVHEEYSRYNPNNTSLVVHTRPAEPESSRDLAFLGEMAGGRARLLFVAGPRRGEHVDFKAHVVLGRASGCDIVLAEDVISRRHADLFVQEQAVLLRDLGSTHGVLLNGCPIRGVAQLDERDVFQIGDHVLKISLAE